MVFISINIFDDVSERRQDCNRKDVQNLGGEGNFLIGKAKNHLL
jgi:hypothetical protein